MQTLKDNIARFFQKLEIDTRLFIMFIALGLIWLIIDVLSGGTFLTPRNLWNLSVQASVVGIMSAGMVLIIVTRNIDLSVGSVLGVVGMVMAFFQVRVFPLETDYNWILSILIGLTVGTLIGGFQGFIVAYGKVPAFIVTLGGLLIFRGLAWWITSGQTLAPMDTTFQVFGGGIRGSIGSFWSWILGLGAILFIWIKIISTRRRRAQLEIHNRPLWAETLIFVVQVLAISAFVWVMNEYPLPKSVTGGEIIARGIAVPVLIMILVAIFIHYLATRTTFGRYCFAIGGNPESADLVGVNTRKTLTMVFMLMGFLVSVSAMVATARLNAGLNSTGTLSELSVIAAAVIGGTSLAGGIGTILGAMLGAIIMQSLQSGMVLLGLPSPVQNVVIGLVLVLAVWLDSLFQKGRR